MKKIMIFILILLFSITVNVLPVAIPGNFFSYFDLLFLNVKNFNQYNLMELNFQYLICFCLLNEAIMYILLSNMNESITFLYMIIYRNGIVKTFVNLCKQNVWNIIKIILEIVIMISVVFLIQNRFSIHEDIKTFVVIGVYFIKYFFMFLIFTVQYNLLSFIGKYSQSIIVIDVSIVLLVLIDMLFKTNFICFSNQLSVELSYCIFYLIFTVLLILFSTFYLKKKGDIL